jgi:hypothetical protein
MYFLRKTQRSLIRKEFIIMKIAKRYLAVVLSFALFLALPLAFTQEAAAASKTKITQPAMEITSSAWYNGTPETSFAAYAYNDKGLMSAKVFQNGSQNAYAYNKSGYLTTSARLDKKGNPLSQSIYTVKKGKTTAIANYDIEDGKVTLESAWQISYKKGKVSQEVYSTASGKTSSIATYKKGVLSKVVYVAPDYQEVTLYDKYGNPSSSTGISKGFYDGSTITDTTIYKNTYKNGLLVKTVWTSAVTYSNSSDVDVTNGMDVYTYKKGKLVQKVSARTPSWNPTVTYGQTYVYSYTKGGLISTEAYVNSYTTDNKTEVEYTNTTAYQYKKVAVDKKCVTAVKEAMEEFSYEYFLPGNDYSIY